MCIINKQLFVNIYKVNRLRFKIGQMIKLKMEIKCIN